MDAHENTCPYCRAACSVETAESGKDVFRPLFDLSHFFFILPPACLLKTADQRHKNGRDQVMVYEVMHRNIRFLHN